MALTNAYDSLALYPINNTCVLVDDVAAEGAACASDGEASHPSAESPEKSFGMKDDGLANMFEIYYIVTVSRMLLYT